MTQTKGKIIVVDDDPAMSLALRRFLTASGFRTLTFDSAEDLLDDGVATTADCLVLDIHLTGLSGLELRRQLQERGTDPPTVFITGDESLASLSAVHAPSTPCLRKPFSGQRLLAAIREVLDRVNEESKRL